MKTRKMFATALIIVTFLSAFAALTAFDTVKAVTLSGTIGAIEADSNGLNISPTASSWVQQAPSSPDGNTPFATGKTCIGDTVYVNIEISSVPCTTTGTGSGTTATTGIYGYSLNLNWSPSNLNLTSVQQGTYLSQDGSTLLVGGSSSLFDNVHGTILGGVAVGYIANQVLSMHGSTAVAQVSSGVLLQLQFIVTGSGTGTVTVTNPLLFDNSADAMSSNGIAATIGTSIAVTLNVQNVPLTIVSSYGTPTPAVGTQSFPDGDTITAIVPSPVTAGENTYTCTGWTGTGSACIITGYDDNGNPIFAYSGSGSSLSFAMDSTLGTSTLTWTWVNSGSSSLALTVASAYGSPSPAVGSQSYTSGASVTASVSSPVTVGSTTYTCTGWTGTGSVPATGTTTSTTFTIVATSSITWNWQLTSGGTPVSLTVSSSYGSPSPAVGSNNYNSGDSVTCSIPTTSVSVGGVTYNTLIVGGVTYACTGWTGTGSVPASGTVTTTTFTITQPSSITWNWITLPSSLDVYTDNGGQGWNATASPYGPGAQVTIYASLTYGGAPVAQQLIAFYVYDSGIPIAFNTTTTGSNGIATVAFRLPLTLSSGASAFGIINITSTVNVGGKALNDSCPFKYNYLLQSTNIKINNSDSYGSTITTPSFSRYSGSQISITITVTNINWTAVSFYLAATIYDSNSVPVAYVCLPEAINPAQSGTFNTNSQTFTITLTIPTYAFVGSATLYTNLFNDNPANFGTPFCLEYSTPLLIDASQ